MKVFVERLDLISKQDYRFAGQVDDGTNITAFRGMYTNNNYGGPINRCCFYDSESSLSPMLKELVAKAIHTKFTEAERKVRASKRKLRRENRILMWSGQSDVIVKMWREGKFGEPFFFRRCFGEKHPKNILLRSDGLENPDTQFVALWVGPVVNRSVPIIINLDDVDYLYVFSDSFATSPKTMVIIPTSAMIRIALPLGV